MARARAAALRASSSALRWCEECTAAVFASVSHDMYTGHGGGLDNTNPHLSLCSPCCFHLSHSLNVPRHQVAHWPRAGFRVVVRLGDLCLLLLLIVILTTSSTAVTVPVPKLPLITSPPPPQSLLSCSACIVLYIVPRVRLVALQAAVVMVVMAA